MKKTILAVTVASLLFTGCTDEQKASSSIEKTPTSQNSQMAKGNVNSPMSKMGQGMGNGMGQGKMADYRFVSIDKVKILQKGEAKHYCPVCGMTLNHFYKTNHVASHNGYDKQYCSIHCAAEDKEVNQNDLANFRVVDNDTLKFIDSQKAYFVVGSSKPGTMSVISKYAFGSKQSAQEFSSKFGGKIMSFDEVYAQVKSGLAKDIAKIDAKQKKMAKMGEKFYKKMCKPTDKNFTSIAQAKGYIAKSGICGNMKGKQLQAVGIYLGKK